MDSINDLSFERAFEELDTIVAKLESGELSLEDSVTLYERGRLLSAHCQALLDQAELRVQQLADDGSLRPL
ncbi:MAG: exodeoxyribonuclease VII small subunit [Anaerolineae bacterium]|jgi:exodeoxyribonuclease VII small subunit|nr:exodeoxyribonuclease VII small subunit [Anaerolineae bacterium]